MRQVLPVIHFLDTETALAQATLAVHAGADGVFLIAHRHPDNALFEPARLIKTMHPRLKVGLNLLRTPAPEALLLAQSHGVDMVWADAPGVSSLNGVSDDARRIGHALARKNVGWPTFFGSVAFKYQPFEAQPAFAAKLAADLGMLPTTSGTATGSAPKLSKIQAMAASLGPGARLAVASGLTPENVEDFLPYVTDYLVATGVSVDDYRFDPQRLALFVSAVKGSGS